MTTPTIFATGYDANSIKRAPKLVNGSSMLVKTTTTLPASTATSTNVGLMPFNKGAKISMASNIYITDLDTATTATGTLGWVYDSASYTDDPDGFAASFTTPQAGGKVEFSAAAGYPFQAEGDGWVVYVVGGEAVETAGTIYADIHVTY